MTIRKKTIAIPGSLLSRKDFQFFMAKFKEIMIGTMMPAIKAIGKAELEAVLSGIKEHNTAEIYRTTLQGLHSNFSLLREAAYKTKTKIDDGLVDLVLEAVKESADRGDIVLS